MWIEDDEGKKVHSPFSYLISSNEHEERQKVVSKPALLYQNIYYSDKFQSSVENFMQKKKVWVKNGNLFNFRKLKRVEKKFQSFFFDLNKSRMKITTRSCKS